METPAQRLGELVQEQRQNLGMYTIAEAAGRGGLTSQTWAKVETGRPAKPRTYRKIEDVLQWRRGSCENVLDGGDPIPLPITHAVRRQAMEAKTFDEMREAAQSLLRLIDDLERRFEEQDRREVNDETA